MRNLMAVVVMVLMSSPVGGCADECVRCAEFDVIGICVNVGDCAIDGEEIDCSGLAPEDCPLLNIAPGQTLVFQVQVGERANDLQLILPAPPPGAEDKASDLRNATVLINGESRDCERTQFRALCVNLASEQTAVQVRLEDGALSTKVYIFLQDAECIQTQPACGL